MSLQNNKKQKNLNSIQVGQQDDESPRFGKQIPKAGKYGQPPQKFIKQSKQFHVPNPTKIINQQEIALHNTEKSAWISLKGIVYDVTDYMKHHPGGKILLQGCGKQSQKLFNEHHSWVNAKNILSNCIIGKLENP